MTLKDTYNVIFDGDCGFCQSSVNFIKRLDWLNKFQFIPFQDKKQFQNYKQLTEEMCKKEMFLVKPKGNHYGGYDAFRIIFVFIPVTFVVSWIFFLPGITQIGRAVYKLIAKNRHKIKINGSSCKIDGK